MTETDATANPLPRPQPRVLLLGPYYTPVGYYGQLEAFGRQVDLTTVLPDVSGFPLFDPNTPWDDPERRLDVRGLPLIGSDRIPTNLPDRVHICPLVDIPGSKSQLVMLGVSKWIRKTRPDVVVVTGKLWSNTFWRANLAIRAFAPQAKLVSVVKRNTYPPMPRAEDAVKRRIGQAGLKRAAKVVAASQMASDMYRREFGAPACKLAVAPLAGIDTDAFAPAPLGSRPGPELTIGYCGRFDAQKGTLLLVEAVERSRSQGHRLQLHLVGHGPHRPQLREMATTRSWLKISDPVPMEELSHFMRSVDMYVLAATTSAGHEEHDGHALLQAMATGLPCIGTRSGIIPEILLGGEGLVVPANDVDAIAESIGQLVADPDQRARLGAEARRAAVSRYSFDAVAQAHATIWREIGR